MWFIIAFAVQLLLGEFMRPKRRDNSAPPQLKNFNVPTADESRSIPVVFGTVKLDAPNVTWYGDLQTMKLYKNVKAGLFSSQKVELGYRNSLGIHFALCMGPVDAITEIQWDDKTAWTGNISSGDFTVEAIKLFGGDAEEEQKKGGEGGVFAACTFYNGSLSQAQDPYLTSVLGTVPAYRGVCHLVWKGPSSGVVNQDPAYLYINKVKFPFLSGYVGINQNLKNTAFIVKRLPNYLNPSYYDIGGDANPADVLYELLTSYRWGLNLTTNYINVATFQAAQQTLHTEGLGFSDVWDNDRPISEVIDEVLRYIDGTIYSDIKTGKLTLRLNRNDYNPLTIPVFNEDNIIELTNHSVSAWDETTNEVIVPYIDRANKFKQKNAIAQDLANVNIQGAISSTRVNYVGISNATAASKISFRDLKVLSIPLAKCSLKVNRSAIDLRPTDVIKISFPQASIVNKIFRISKIGYGQLDNGIMEIEAVQDIFSLQSSTFSSPPSSGWTDPNGTPSVVTNFLVTEAPYFIKGNNIKLQVFAERPNNFQYAFNTYISQTTSTGTYFQIDSGDSYTPTATINSIYSNLTSAYDSGGIIITPTTPNLLYLLQSNTAEIVQKGNNLFLMNGEIMAFENVVDNLNGTYTISGIWRGLLDTTPKYHISGSKIYFMGYGESSPDPVIEFGNVHTKLESVSATGKSALSAVNTYVTKRRAFKPYAPGKFLIDGGSTNQTVTNGNNDILLSWEHRNRIEQTNVIKQDATGLRSEERVTYSILIYNGSNSLVRTVTGLSGTTYTYTAANQLADNSGSNPTSLTFVLYSVREGLSSWQAQIRNVTRTGGTVVTNFPAYNPTDNYTPVTPSDTISIGGVPVDTTVTPTNNNVLVYNSTTGTYVPSAVPTLTMGTINSQTKSVNGAVITGGNLVMQTADATSVGLVSIGTQSFAGNKTFTGEVLFSKRSVHTPIALTDAANIATDASLGNRFRVTITANRTLSAPTNPSDGQQCLWEITQDATGGRTLTLDTGAGGFEFTADIPSITASTAATKTDLLTAIYRSSSNKWIVAGFLHG